MCVFLYIATESDLKLCPEVNTCHVTKNNYSRCLFSPESRPECVKISYDHATDNPIRIIRQCNVNRTDGCTGSMMFTLAPIFQDEINTYEEDEMDDIKVGHQACQHGAGVETILVSGDNGY